MTATRRRGDTLEHAIHDAVLAEVLENGYAGANYESVAARASTSKTVLYRRWGTKAEMVMAAMLARHDDSFAAPEASDLAGDIKNALRAVRDAFQTTGRETMLMLMAELDRSSGEALRHLLFSRGTELLGPAMQRARDRGELGEQDLHHRLLSLPFDLVRNELAMAGTLPDDVIDEIVNVVVMPLLTTRSRP